MFQTKVEKESKTISCPINLFFYPGINGGIILRLIIGKWDMGVWTVSRWLRIGTGGGHL
jgi:hypothetical protein